MIPRRVLPLLAFAAPAQAAAPAWLGDLRRGGYVLYMRHGITDRAQADTGRLFDRAGQRNLSAAGIAQVEAVSAAFDRLRIPLGLLRTSPVYRASDTAALMARGRPVDITMDLVADDYTADVPGAIATLRRALATPPAPGTNTLLVGHIHKLGPALGRWFAQEEFPEGAVAVLRPGPPAGFTLLRILPAAEILAAPG